MTIYLSTARTLLILSFLLFISGIVATVKFFYESKLMTKEIVVNGFMKRLKG